MCTVSRFKSRHGVASGRMDDGFEAAAQPHCERCGTVMRDWVGGFKCSHCDIVVLRTAAR